LITKSDFNLFAGFAAGIGSLDRLRLLLEVIVDSGNILGLFWLAVGLAAGETLLAFWLAFNDHCASGD
jgi:hypothetical protein